MRLPRRRVALILAASTALPFGAAVAVSSANQSPSPSPAAPHRSPTVPPQVLPYHHAPTDLTPVPHVHRQPHTGDPPGPHGPSGPRPQP